MKLSRLASLSIFLSVVGPAVPAQSVQDLDAIRPATQELKWRRIPWVLDLASGQQTARRENRPIFLWATGDDPLERC